jgi:group II intron reverse transcriptase/maturase
MSARGGWVLELDIEDFFGSLDHQHMVEILRRRVRDGVLLRLIGKWLNAGVVRDGGLSYPDGGTPQGGVISPLLANIYLHAVLDEWFEDEVRPRLRGDASLVRFADDAVLVFELEEDARRVAEVLPKRLGRYGLRLHPAKTRLLPFARPGSHGSTGSGRRETFDFLGFTHYWGRSRRRIPVVKRKTASARLSRALRAIREWCRIHRHMPVAAQHRALERKVRGHDAYYGITGNGAALQRFHYEVGRIWRKWLDRRSWRARMKWDRFNELLKRYPLPQPRVVHSIYRNAARP